MHEIALTLEFMDWLARNNGWRTEDLCDLRRQVTPLPSGVWPDRLDARGVWFWDRAGRTLVIDGRGRLAEGPTIAERMELAATANAKTRREERDLVFEAVIERLQGRLDVPQPPQEIERSAVDSQRPF